MELDRDLTSSSVHKPSGLFNHIREDIGRIEEQEPQRRFFRLRIGFVLGAARRGAIEGRFLNDDSPVFIVHDKRLEKAAHVHERRLHSPSRISLGSRGCGSGGGGW